MSNKQNTPPHNKIHSLYFIKGLCAFLVVACHTPLNPDALYSEAINAVAVPIFFMITGYFLYHQDTDTMKQRISKSIKKVIPIIIILQLIYYPIAPISQSFSEGWISYLRLFLFGFHSFKTIHLWYLTALLEGLIFLYIYLKLFKGKYLIYLLPLALSHLVLGRFSGIVGIGSDLFLYNAITYAIPFLALGAWVKEYENKLLSLNHWLDYAIGIIILSHIDYLTLKSYVFLVPLALSLFMCCLSNKKMGENTYISTIGEKYAGNIYYFHLIVAYTISDALDFWGLSSYYQDFGTFIVFVASLLLAYLIVRVQDKMGWSILR